MSSSIFFYNLLALWGEVKFGRIHRALGAAASSTSELPTPAGLSLRPDSPAFSLQPRRTPGSRERPPGARPCAQVPALGASSGVSQASNSRESTVAVQLLSLGPSVVLPARC